MELRLRRANSAAAIGSGPLRIRVHVKSNGILALHPLFEWPDWQEESQTFRFFPESPGLHRLVVSWSAPGGQAGWAEHEIHVAVSDRPEMEPVLADAASGIRLWAPSRWEAQSLRSHESDVLILLGDAVAPGSVVYDIGANLGLFSIFLGQRAGATGQVYAFEANPLCVYLLRANLSRHPGVRCEILPAALSDRSGRVEFTVNYDNLNLGVGRDSPFFELKTGHRIEVESYSLDGLVARLRLRPPDVMKIDIEGAEAAALRGMRATLGSARPVILAELHGRQAASESMVLLDELDYVYLDPESRKTYDGSASLLSEMPDRPIQILARPR